MKSNRMSLSKETTVKPTMHGRHLTGHLRCLLAAVMASLLFTTSAQVSGQTACVPLATVDLRPSVDTLAKLSSLERYGAAFGIVGRLSPSCSGELTGTGTVASPGYPCQPSWQVDDNEGTITCVWILNSAPANGGDAGSDLWRVRLDHLSLSPEVGSTRLLVFDSFPPTGIRHVNLADPLSNKYLNFRNAATVVLISAGRDMHRTKFLLTVSATSTEAETHNTTLSTTQPIQNVDLKDSTSQGDNVCTPMTNATHEVKQQSEEMTSLVNRYLVLYKSHYGTAANLTCLEKLRGSGLVISRNYPCDYPNFELCVWILYSEDAPAYSSTSNRGTTIARGRRSRIRLRFVSFVTEQTYDQLLVVLPAPPPMNYIISHSLSGNLIQNYTIDLDTEQVILIFNSSERTTDSGFMIDFTTVVDNGRQVMKTSNNTCTPMTYATNEVKQLSEETTNLVNWYLAVIAGNDGTPVNLTCLKELRGSGLVISRNYPCDYPDLEICIWVLYAEDVPAHSNTASGHTKISRSGRTGIRLRFVSFVTEPTYDQLVVAVLAPPPKHYIIRYSFSGNLTENYTIELDSELVVLVFTASKATTASGFMIDFTTVIDNDGQVVETTARLNIEAIVSVVAVVIFGSAIVTCIVYKRRLNKNRGKAQKPKKTTVAHSAKPGTAAYTNQAMEFDVLSKKDGLVFGGSSRPGVLLVYCEDDRTHCAVVDSLAQILRSLGGCDVSTISATQHSKYKQIHVDWSAAIGCGQLTSAAMQADRIILFASRGADLVEEAFISGKVYPRLYRASATYLTIPHVMQLCTTCSAVRDKTLVVVYYFREDDRQNASNGSAASNDGTTLSLPRSTIGQLLGAKVPEFRLPEQMPRLVAALHGATPAEAAAAANSSCAAGMSCDVIELLLRAQGPVMWSCLEEYESSNERRQLISCVAAVEQSGIQGLQGVELFEAAHGPAVDWLDQTAGFTGSVGAMRLSVTAESYQLSASGLTDVVTLPSITGLCASSDSGISEPNSHADYGGSSSVLTKKVDEHIGSDEVYSGRTADVRSSVQFS